MLQAASNKLHDAKHNESNGTRDKHKHHSVTGSKNFATSPRRLKHDSDRENCDDHPLAIF